MPGRPTARIPERLLRWFTACLLACIAFIARADDGSLGEVEKLLLAQRARPDPVQFERAKVLVAAEVERNPTSAKAWTLMAWTCMAEHRFGAALDAAKRADTLASGDPRNLALMSDALTELGRYPEAVRVTQRLVDLDPGVPAWTRAARQRFLHNDLDGAIDLMARAARAGTPRGEATAWVWVELARLQEYAGRVSDAARALDAAEAAYPELPGLLPARAGLLVAQGQPRPALVLYRQALAQQPAADVALAAWRLAREVEEQGTAKHYAALLDGLVRLDAAGLSRRPLAEFLCDNDQPERAVELARQELAARPDIYSHATLARALARAGNVVEATRHARLALALDTPDPLLQRQMRAILAGERGTQSQAAHP